MAKPFIGRSYSSVLKLSDKDVAALSINDSGNDSFSFAVNSVDLPVSDLGSVLRFQWPLLDHRFPGQTASGVISPITLASLLAGSAQVLIQRPSRHFILPHVAIDRLVADGKVAMPSQPS